LAGILVEVLPDRRHVIGIGLNVNNRLADAPVELQDTAATLRDLSGVEHDRTGVLIDLLRRLDAAFLQLREDPAKVAGRADSLCLQRGRSLTLRWSNRKVAGVCRGIAADGAIMLETPGGIETFRSGSVES
jgi:BirA family biotin operon repressor/biotin-[acetyl-CoA-carboxylase] ligase